MFSTGKRSRRRNGENGEKPGFVFLRDLRASARFSSPGPFQEPFTNKIDTKIVIFLDEGCLAEAGIFLCVLLTDYLPAHCALRACSPGGGCGLIPDMQRKPLFFAFVLCLVLASGCMTTTSTRAPKAIGRTGVNVEVHEDGTLQLYGNPVDRETLAKRLIRESTCSGSTGSCGASRRQASTMRSTSSCAMPSSMLRD